MAKFTFYDVLEGVSIPSKDKPTTPNNALLVGVRLMEKYNRKVIGINRDGKLYGYIENVALSGKPFYFFNKKDDRSKTGMIQYPLDEYGRIRKSKKIWKKR